MKTSWGVQCRQLYIFINSTLDWRNLIHSLSTSHIIIAHFSQIQFNLYYNLFQKRYVIKSDIWHRSSYNSYNWHQLLFSIVIFKQLHINSILRSTKMYQFWNLLPSMYQSKMIYGRILSIYMFCLILSTNIMMV